jgi:hypothetical protein
MRQAALNRRRASRNTGSAASSRRFWCIFPQLSENILKRLLSQEVVGASAVPALKPQKVEPSKHPRRKKTGVL